MTSYYGSFFLILVLAVSAKAQMPVDPETGRFLYQEVVEVPGAKDDLYVKAQTWFVNTFRDAKEVIQLQDKDAGRVMGKGLFRLTLVMLTRSIHFTITIDVKDDRYRYTITDFIIEWHNTGNDVHNFEEVTLSRRQLYNKTDAMIQELIANLKTTMSQSSPTQDDW